MPKIIRIPPYSVIPKRSGRREFLEEMFYLYRRAGSPALREVEDWIKNNDDLRGTASSETVRRVLRGHVPHRWPTGEAIMLAFCSFADMDPEADRWPYEHGDAIPMREHVRQLWAAAIEEDPDVRPQPTPDLWATADGEPPF